jgi:ADP-heptose:LPS heptosyltransferase
MRVLALVPGGISEQLLFFPTLEDIKRAFPHSEIDVVADPLAQAAYRVSKIVDEVIPFNFAANNSPADWANLLGIIRDREFEVALSTSGRWEEGFLLWLSGIPNRVTYGSTRTPWFYTRTVPDKNNQYRASRYQDLLRGLNIGAGNSLPTINVPESDIAWAESTRQQMGLTGGYVLIYPAPSTPLKGTSEPYPVTSWATIITDFQTKQPQLPVLLLKTDESAPAVQALTEQQPALKVVDPENLGQVAAIIAGADLVLTPDNEILQLAAALQVFTLALLSATPAAHILPPSQPGKEARLVSIQSNTQKLVDLSPQAVLQKVWGG